MDVIYANMIVKKNVHFVLKENVKHALQAIYYIQLWKYVILIVVII